jgi:hydroxylamine reductase
MGQCNDAYGAIQVALALAKAFDCSVNDLPLTLVVSWFEQKAVAVLLSLLALNVQGIAIGPKPPAFVTPAVFAALQDRFDLKLTGTDAKADLAAALALGTAPGGADIPRDAVTLYCAIKLDSGR